MRARSWTDVGRLPMSRRDRAALVLAYECARRWRFAADSAVSARRALSMGEGAALDLLCDTNAISVRETGGRQLRARLALALRVLLRVDRGDFGRTEWVGCHCACDGDRGGWVPAPVRPLWEQAPAWFNDGMTPRVRRAIRQAETMATEMEQAR